MEKTILMILNQKFLPDIRVEKEVKVLKEEGYRIVILASEEGYDDDNYEVVRLNSLNSYRTKISSYFLKVNNSLEKEIIEKVKKIEKIDFIHVHDLFWGNLGVHLSRIFDSKLIVDFHENYPAGYLQWNSNNTLKAYLKKSILNYDKLKKYELEIVEKADKVILVVEEAKKRFFNNFSDEKFVIVSNTERPEDWKYVDVEKPNEKFIISYIGGIGPHRGVDTVIQGMTYLDESYLLYIVGMDKKNPYYKAIENLKRKNNKNNIILVDWVPFNKVKDYIIRSHVCLVPHNKSEHAETTIPHKLFQYMAMKRPVLVSDVSPLKRIVEETRSGEVFTAGDPKSFAQKVKEMNDFEKLRQYGENGRLAVEGKYNWENDAKRLINLYRELENVRWNKNIKRFIKTSRK